MTPRSRLALPTTRPSDDGGNETFRRSFDPQVERSVPSAPVDGGVFTNSFLRKVKSTSAKNEESVKSPRSSKLSEPSSPRAKENTAAAMLSPVLSRVREQHRQAELQNTSGEVFGTFLFLHLSLGIALFNLRFRWQHIVAMLQASYLNLLAC